MPKSELITAFEKCKKEGRPSLLTYQVAGDPNKKKSFDILKELCSDKRKSKLYPFELFNIIINSGILMKAKEPSGMLIKEIDSLKDL